jgi:hypothetical protein
MEQEEQKEEEDGGVKKLGCWRSIDERRHRAGILIIISAPPRSGCWILHLVAYPGANQGEVLM